MSRHDGIVAVPQVQAFEQYLLLAGWSLQDDDGRTRLWRPSSSPGKKLQIVLPALEDADDWRERVQEALRTLAYSERRLPDEIAEDISFGGADTVAVRLTPDTPEGQAPLPLASAAVTALHLYVVGSASALDIQDLVLPSRRPPWVDAYANRVRLATKEGSFVLNLMLPLAARIDSAERAIDHQTLFTMPPQPVGRRVTNRMRQAARSALRLADQVMAGERTIEAFAEDRHAAVANSTELSAIKALGGPESEAYQIRFAQSPLAGDREEPVSLEVTPERQRVIGNAAVFLRSRQPKNDVTVQGSVVRLHRDRVVGPGEITVVGPDEDSGSVRHWRVELAEEDYKNAVQAHFSGLQVSVTGDREERGSYLQLRRPSLFAVITGLDFGFDPTTGVPRITGTLNIPEVPDTPEGLEDSS
jgi:hypothetical protein